MLSRLHIVPAAEDAMLNIWVNLCLLVLRPRGSMVLKGSHIMNAPAMLRITPPVKQWERETLKGSIYDVKPSIPALMGARR